jgi:hypothetical protein
MSVDRSIFNKKILIVFEEYLFLSLFFKNHRWCLRRTRTPYQNGYMLFEFKNLK